jgi:hypothetical protein
MPRTLDRNRPFAEHYGMEPAKYAQDGYAFLADGTLMPEPDAIPPARSDFIDQLMAPIGKEEVLTPRKIKSDDMRLKENQALKLQMENYGEPWQGVEHARRYLGLTEE